MKQAPFFPPKTVLYFLAPSLELFESSTVSFLFLEIGYESAVVAHMQSSSLYLDKEASTSNMD